VHLGHVADDLLEGRVGEGVELHLDDRPHAVDGHAHGHSDDAGFRQGRVEAALLTEGGFISPSVMRKTPPSMPTSSPKTRTDSSARMASAMAVFRAFAMVTGCGPAASAVAPAEAAARAVAELMLPFASDDVVMVGLIRGPP
jgi:hypothetical protein